MKPEFSSLTDADCSCLQIEVLVEESWINQLLAKQELMISVSDKYSLSNLRIRLEEGKLTMLGEINEKEGSAISVICLPKWDTLQQRIHLDELEIKTHSKNLLVKSAGWFANTFMGAKIDKKIEEVANRAYNKQLDTMMAEGITIPISKEGITRVRLRSLVISEMTFLDQSIKVKAMIDGHWHLHLSSQL